MSTMKNVHWGFSIRDIFRAVFGIEHLPQHPPPILVMDFVEQINISNKAKLINGLQ